MTDASQSIAREELAGRMLEEPNHAMTKCGRTAQRRSLLDTNEREEAKLPFTL
jgi:hypothetical protein